MGSLHLFPVEKFLLLLLRPLRVEGIYSQKLKVCFGACLDSTVGAAGQDRGSCGLCHNLPLHPKLIYSWDNCEEPLAESMAGVKAGPCCCSLSGPKSKSRGRSARSPCRVPHWISLWNFPQRQPHHHSSGKVSRKQIQVAHVHFLAITGKLSFLGGTGELLAWKMTGVKELGKGHTGRTALTRTGAFGGGLGAVCLSRGNSPCFHEAESNLE